MRSNVSCSQPKHVFCANNVKNVIIVPGRTNVGFLWLPVMMLRGSAVPTIWGFVTSKYIFDEK